VPRFVSVGYKPVRNRVRDKLQLTDEMGRPVSMPAFYGMRLRRAKMPMRIRGHIDLPILTEVCGATRVNSFVHSSTNCSPWMS
jgi:hypothetical protein